MVVRIVIAGESQCKAFAEICLVADHLSKKLPDFRYERIEKPVLEWNAWMYKINQKNKWHHSGSPLVWKELLATGSKPFYIGGGPEFLDYCYSYYKFDVFMAPARYENLVLNYRQYNKKIKQESKFHIDVEFEMEENTVKNTFSVCISGSGNPITMHLISELLEMSSSEKGIYKVYIYDHRCSSSFMELVERECSFIETNYAAKVVKYVDKIGLALTNTDVLIILDHVPFSPEQSIGGWLYENKKIMHNIAQMINASASSKMKIILPNLGPACYNATVLSESLTHICKNNIVIATSDLGMEVTPIIAKIAEIPMRNMFCPPVWGFVGVNHLVDINNSIHKYNEFYPFNRYKKVKNSSLCIGSLTPQMRTIEYLIFFDESLWIKVAEEKTKSLDSACLNKSIAILDLLKSWLVDENPEEIITLGVHCDGSFGLDFDGYFSQPCRLNNGKWRPFKNYMLPKTPHMTLSYLLRMAKFTMTLEKNDLPRIIPRKICICKRKQYVKKNVWY
ncbi:putative malate dehydrogenase 1B [Pieris napi]|uniref:putative malate dehydrogenase 1B n=1 Tax=Pieris napi TaxID=78633 RepID=UPI001FB97CD3|nr:putative malate dehydrogenase 1B [Pieris napi]